MDKIKEPEQSHGRDYMSNPNTENKKCSEEEKLIREPIEGTPFHIIGSKAKGYFIALGNARITEITETEEQTIEKLETEKYSIIGTMIVLTYQKMEEQKNSELLNAIG